MFNSLILRRYTKLVCGSTLFLIFAGGLVKSTESGLAVPDWPLSYGTLFPPMVGGVFYEHSHRMVAFFVGLLVLVLTVWLFRASVEGWVKKLGVAALLAVIAQGVLGGMAVLFFLPVLLSSAHGVLAQTFFCMTVLLAYAFCVERQDRLKAKDEGTDTKFLKYTLILFGMVYIQLMIANVLRHTGSGLAVPDFPTMGGSIIPSFDQSMLNRINAWRFEQNLEPVTMGQVYIHILHRVWAFLILAKLFFINYVAYRDHLAKPLVMKTLYWLNLAMFVQIMLGISTVIFKKEVYTTTAHVTMGAVVLGLSLLLVLRSSPMTWAKFKGMLSAR